MTYSPNNPRLVPIHNFLVAACETERDLPDVSLPGLKTLWPATSVERNVDYKPGRTKVTKCKPTGRQIDNHSRALAMVVEALSSEVDRRIVWAVAKSAVFRVRGPRWDQVTKILQAEGSGYPKSAQAQKIAMRNHYLASFGHNSLKIDKTTCG